MSSSSSAVSPVVVATIALVTALSHPTHAFVMPQTTITPSVDSSALIAAESFALFSTITATHLMRPKSATTTALFMSTSTAGSTISLSLEKPLGLILEESEDGSGGVIVTEVNEGGSAYDSPSAEQLIQSKISMVMEQDVSSLSFDDVMDAIINAPSPFDIKFSLSSAAVAAATTTESETADEDDAATPSYDVGAPVTITVQQPETNKPEITLNGKVGDNLRKTILANKDIELYRGLKKKLGNCGGGGQCGFCAVELIDEEGVWGDRSDYEAQRIGKNGNEKCRLACMNNIVGPATVRTL